MMDTLIEIKRNLQGTNSREMKPRIKSMIWNMREQKKKEKRKEKKTQSEQQEENRIQKEKEKMRIV